MAANTMWFPHFPAKTFQSHRNNCGFPSNWTKRKFEWHKFLLCLCKINWQSGNRELLGIVSVLRLCAIYKIFNTRSLCSLKFNFHTALVREPASISYLTLDTSPFCFVYYILSRPRFEFFNCYYFAICAAASKGSNYLLEDFWVWTNDLFLLFFIIWFLFCDD